MFTKYFIASLSGLIIYSCSYINSGTATDPNLAGALESGITISSAIADDLGFSGIVGTSSLNTGGQIISADEYSCTGGWSSCSSGVRTRTANCTNTVTTYIKDVIFNFFNQDSTTDASCVGLSTVGNYIVRTGSDVVSLPSIGTFTSSSSVANNYGGTPIGGGAKIIKNADGSDSVFISGITAIMTNTAGGSVWNNSIYTDPGTPLVLNQLTRDGRVVSGTVIVNNNLAGFTASMTFTGVTYSVGCCYPVGGTITATLSGSRTGTATMTFGTNTTCGSATLVTETSTTVNVGMSTCSSSIN